MRKLIPLALVACLGLGAVTMSGTAHAAVAVSVGVPLPGVVIAPPIAPWPYYRGVARYGYWAPARYGYRAPLGYRYAYGPGWGWGRYGYVRGRVWR